MSKTDDLSYFALSKPLSDEHIFTILGRVIPWDQLQRPLSGRIRPLPPTRTLISGGDTSGNRQNAHEELQPTHRASAETEDGHSRPSASEHRQDATVADSGSAMTEVGTLQRGSGEHHDGHEVNPLKGSQQGVDLLKLDPDLYPVKAVVCRDINILKRKAVSVKAKGAVEDMLKLYANFEKNTSSSISANAFRRIDVPNPQDRITELLRHNEYADPIIDLLREQESGKAAIIVSILTCTDLTKTQKSLQHWGLGGRLQNPGLQQGQPVPSVEAEVDGTVTTYEELSGTYEGEVIIACSYLKLRLVAAPPDQQGIWYKITQAFRRFRHKPLKRSDRIEVSPTHLDPAEGSLYLPSEPVKGTIPVLFGSAGGQETPEESYKTAGKDDLAFTIFA
jgi:hypothetical protein